MQRLKGRILLLGALAVLACSVDPTDNEGTPTAITANPEVVFVAQGDSQPVIASVVDEDGQILQADITHSNVGGGIEVIEDPTFLGTTTGVGINRQTRFFVKGVDLTATTFTLNGLGLTKEIQVTSVPANFAGTFSTLTPALGDTISITAPTGTFFTDASVITFGGAEPVIVSKDATTITFIPFPNIFGPGVVSAVGVASNPNLTFDLPTPDTLVTDSIPDAGGNVAPTSPALGGVVTLVLPPELRVIPESLVQSGVGADTIQRGLRVAGSDVQPLNITASADSTTITFIPPPNADSVVEVPGVIARRLPMYPLLLSTTATVTTPVIDSVPSTVSTATPAANEEVTLTITDAAFALTDTANVVVGAAPVTITGKTANSLTFVPPPGAEGGVTINGIEIGGFALALPSQAGAITVGALTPLAGTNREATAPTLAVPGAGEITTLFDLPDFPAGFGDPVADAAGGGGSAFYKIDVPADGDFTITVDWDIGSDVDVFVCGDPIDSVAFSNCDFAAATGDHPESATYSLTAGTWNIVLNDFGEDATGARVQITIER